MRNTLDKTIIIEGPDGAGKTYLGTFLKKELKRELHHTGGPSEAINIKLQALMVMNSKTIIFDRCPVISELIYGEVLRGKSLISKKEANNYFTWIKLKTIIIFCRPPIETITGVNWLEKPHKSAKHIEQVTDKILKIIYAYDEIIKKLRQKNLIVINFDRTIQSIELFKERILDKC